MNKPPELHPHFEVPKRGDTGLSAELNAQMNHLAQRLNDLEHAIEVTHETILRAQRDFAFAPTEKRDGIAEYERVLSAHLTTLGCMRNELLTANEVLFTQMDHYDAAAARAPGGVIGEV